MSPASPSVKPVTPLGTAFRQSVRDALRRSAAARGLDGVLLLSPANVFYACGFNFSVNERPIGLYVPVEGEAKLFVPLLELENAEPVEGVELAIYEEFPGLVHPVIWMVCQSRATRIAIDGLDAMTWRGLGMDAAFASMGAQLAFAAVFGVLAVWKFSRR